jgi:hypothetical protein
MIRRELLAAIVLTISSNWAFADEARRPNVVFFIADDK